MRRDLRELLEEFAGGQDAEAWAAEDDRVMRELKAQAKVGTAGLIL